jgi:transaldolase
MNPLVQLHAHGQSFWYDNIRRRFLRDGTIEDLIRRDGLRGMTSNPSIFQKAIGQSDDYDAQIRELLLAGSSTIDIYEALALEDIRQACDLFAGVYAESAGRDGFVSLEVSPRLAHDTEATVAEAQRLFAAVKRPNVMIKVPATPEGIPAVRRLLGAGINVNITLMFSMDHYEAVAQAYMAGLADFADHGGDVARLASVASFFVSRVDTAVDERLRERGTSEAEMLLGKIAVANSKVVYQRFKALFHGESFAGWRAKGAPVQRLLWASTSTKDPAFADTKYIDELIGPSTVNTMPQNTLEAFRDHGTVSESLEADVDEARAAIEALANLGIDLDGVAQELQRDGVTAFADSFDDLLDVIASKAHEMQGS